LQSDVDRPSAMPDSRSQPQSQLLERVVRPNAPNAKMFAHVWDLDSQRSPWDESLMRHNRPPVIPRVCDYPRICPVQERCGKRGWYRDGTNAAISPYRFCTSRSGVTNNPDDLWLLAQLASWSFPSSSSLYTATGLRTRSSLAALTSHLQKPGATAKLKGPFFASTNTLQSSQ
jgi:hypothetical protein